MKQFAMDVIAFFPRIFRESWWSVRWEWYNRRIKCNRAKRRRKQRELFEHSSLRAKR